jgi:hypothetical protein
MKLKLFITAFSLCFAAACSSNSVISDSSYEGTLSGTNGNSGTLSILINTQDVSQNVNATVDPVGDEEAVALTGSFNTTGNINISGGGYQLQGAAINGIMVGTYTGPGDSSGGFTALLSTNETITNYCGLFTGSDTGPWNLSVSSNNIVAATATGNNSDDTTIYTGTISENTVTLTSVTGATATGTLSGSIIQGTWDGLGDSSGTFSLSSNSCQP